MSFSIYLPSLLEQDVSLIYRWKRNKKAEKNAEYMFHLIWTLFKIKLYKHKTLFDKKKNKHCIYIDTYYILKEWLNEWLRAKFLLFVSCILVICSRWEFIWAVFLSIHCSEFMCAFKIRLIWETWNKNDKWQIL